VEPPVAQAERFEVHGRFYIVEPNLPTLSQLRLLAGGADDEWQFYDRS
jgi:hypothetical protein